MILSIIKINSEKKHTHTQNKTTQNKQTNKINTRGVLHKTRIKKSRIIEQARLELFCSAHPGLIGCTIAEPGLKDAANSSRMKIAGISGILE